MGEAKAAAAAGLEAVAAPARVMVRATGAVAAVEATVAARAAERAGEWAVRTVEARVVAGVVKMAGTMVVATVGITAVATADVMADVQEEVAAVGMQAEVGSAQDAPVGGKAATGPSAVEAQEMVTMATVATLAVSLVAGSAEATMVGASAVMGMCCRVEYSC